MASNTFSMQRDAARRVNETREMQNRIRRGGGSPQFMLPGQRREPPEEPRREEHPHPAERPHAEGHAHSRPPAKQKPGGPNINFLSSLFQDNDQLIILALIFVLMQEDCDNVLLLALVYLLL